MQLVTAVMYDDDAAFGRRHGPAQGKKRMNKNINAMRLAKIVQSPSLDIASSLTNS